MLNVVCMYLVVCFLAGTTWSSVAGQVQAAEEETGHCIWYGQCGADAVTGKPLNCIYNGTAKPFQSTHALQLYQDLCPDLYQGSETKTCCSDSQMLTLADSVAVAVQFLGRCPTCLHNFLNVYCYFTCAQDHSRFVFPRKVSGTTGLQDPASTDKVEDAAAERVMEVDYALTPQMAVGMFNSCRDVQMPSANMRALGLLCGTSADLCTPQGWLDYMGNTDNQQTPFKINFYITDHPYINDLNHTLRPLNTPVIPCSRGLGTGTGSGTGTRSGTGAGSGGGACSCQDCRDTCGAPMPTPAPAEPFRIAGLDGYVVIMGAVFLMFVVVFMGTLLWFHCCKGKVHLGSTVDRLLQQGMEAWGRLCARRPRTVLILGLLIAVALSCGLVLFDVITDPVMLWSAPSSRARLEKDYFDQHFAPFYRTEQVIVTRADNRSSFEHLDPAPATTSSTFSPIFQRDFLHQVLDLQLQIQALRAPLAEDDGGDPVGVWVGLEDICFQPLAPDNRECAVQSVLQYYQNSHQELDRQVTDDFGFYVMADYLHHFDYCVQAPATVNDTTALHSPCLASYGGPVFPWVVLGGYDGTNYRNATALVLTFVVNNYVDEMDNVKAKAWESAFISFLHNYSRHHPDIRLAFSAQRSIEDELDRESRSDVVTIAVSYLIMFLYIAIFLGHYRSLATIVVDSKVTLGFGGVVIVLLSVAVSLGVFSFLGQPATLIIIEVVPFLVLAVGVDNIFILVQTLQRDVRKDGEGLEAQIGRVVGKAGPSMLLTSASESLAFFLGALTDMPAVRIFSLYAGMAVLANFLLQITCFVALMTLDALRMESNRPDVGCCVQLSSSPRSGTKECVVKEGLLFFFFRRFYARGLMNSCLRPLVVVVFVFWFCSSVALTPRIDVGLDQALSMPKDSYVLNYFSNMTAYLSVGPPVYFVVRDGYNYSTPGQQNALCGGHGCLDSSLLGQLFKASRLPLHTRLAQPATSWIDDYLAWLSPQGKDPCCRLHNTTGLFCPATSKDADCMQCPLASLAEGRPKAEDFLAYLPHFLTDNPDTQCALGGHAAYSSGVQLLDRKTRIGATYFMTYHTVLKTSSDYVDALRRAREISANISATLRGVSSGFHDNLELDEVFPYSVFYVFYEQYLTIVRDAAVILSICLSAVFLVTFTLLGCDLHSALMVLVTLVMILADLLGVMYFWGISLNALSVVNLSMALGISVEFCSHIIRAFAVSRAANRRLRAQDAITHMGSSVLSGITVTKLVGVFVLAFSKSQLFQVFYFRVYLAIVLVGATHGLVFLPVLLSYLGPGVKKDQSERRVNATANGGPQFNPSFTGEGEEDEAEDGKAEGRKAELASHSNDITNTRL